jgi:GT2 family glycosyltransferase
VAGHAHKNLSRHHSGYFYRSQVIQNISSVTGACLMIKRRLYMKAGGLNETQLPVALNDTDLCLRLAEKGCLNIFTPYCELYHYEAASRGRILTPELLKQVMKDMKYFRKRHAQVLKDGDPYYNPNLPLHTECFGLLTGRTRLVQPLGTNISF